MESRADRDQLFELLYEAREATLDEKAEAWDRFHVAVDRLRQGTPYSRSQVRELLFKSGYREFARRKKLAERTSL